MKKLYFVMMNLVLLGVFTFQAIGADRPDFVRHIANQNPAEFIGWGTGTVKSFFSSKILKDDKYFTWCALKDGKDVKLIFNKARTHSITAWLIVTCNRDSNVFSFAVYDDPLRTEVIIKELLAEMDNIAGFLKSLDFITEVAIGK